MIDILGEESTAPEGFGCTEVCERAAQLKTGCANLVLGEGEGLVGVKGY